MPFDARKDFVEPLCRFMECEHEWRVFHTFGEPDRRVCVRCSRVQVWERTPQRQRAYGPGKMIQVNGSPLPGGLGPDIVVTAPAVPPVEAGMLPGRAWVAKALADSSFVTREIRAQKVSVHDNTADKPKRPRPTTLAGRIAAPFWAFSRMVYGG